MGKPVRVQVPPSAPFMFAESFLSQAFPPTPSLILLPLFWVQFAFPFLSVSTEEIRCPYFFLIITQSACPIWDATHIGFWILPRRQKWLT